MPGVFSFLLFFLFNTDFSDQLSYQPDNHYNQKRSPAQIPTIHSGNLFGCFNRSAIFLLSSTTFRPCVVL